MTSGLAGRVDPFGLWPTRASRFDGLGGAVGPPHAGYVFHTDYVATRRGHSRFTLRFDDLRADGGALRIVVRARLVHEHALRVLKTVTIPLADLVAAGGTCVVVVHARADAIMAVQGDAIGVVRASAGGLAVDLDPRGDGAWHERRLDRARVFEARSAVGRRWWSSTGPVERAGLLSAGIATIADPVSQMCTAAQLEEPAYDAWLADLGLPKHWHRKQWEFIYILAVLGRHDALRPGSRGLGFGCGQEYLPAYFARRGCDVVATDLPAESGKTLGWRETGQHSAELDQLFMPTLCTRADFDRRVTYRPVDMTRIPADLRDFDFCWSACAFEHLGSIAAGLDFIHRAVDCLRPGGVAVHTTELNLSSNGATIDNEATVLFRRRDMERLALDLTAKGYRVLPLNYDRGDRLLDRHVDVAPYSDHAHLKVALSRYVTTSFGIAVVKGG